MKRTWTALSPCPLGKELILIHPRKVYYYLTTLPRQGFPTDSTDILSIPYIGTIRSGGKGGKRIISPSASNASVDEDAEAAEDRRRDALSPSPEVDLFTPELDNMMPSAEGDFPTPPTPAGSSFSGRSSLARDGSSGSVSESVNIVDSHRTDCPLEGDEREFTQTASSMRMRGMSLDETAITESKEVDIAVTGSLSAMHVEETEDEKAKRNREAAATLFGGNHHQQQESSLALMTSPLVKPVVGHIAHELAKGIANADMEESVSIIDENGFTFNWGIKKPENVDLDELDDLFGDF